MGVSDHIGQLPALLATQRRPRLRLRREPLKADGSEAELTPTLKLKRRVILQKFSKEILDMYAEKK